MTRRASCTHYGRTVETPSKPIIVPGRRIKETRISKCKFKTNFIIMKNKSKSKKSKKNSRQTSLKDIIKKSVESIRKRFPNLEKNIIEMYVSYLVPKVCITSQNFDLDDIEYKLNMYINQKMSTLENSINKYAFDLDKNLSECPCRQNVQN